MTINAHLQVDKNTINERKNVYTFLIIKKIPCLVPVPNY